MELKCIETFLECIDDSYTMFFRGLSSVSCKNKAINNVSKMN